MRVQTRKLRTARKLNMNQILKTKTKPQSPSSRKPLPNSFPC